MSEPRIVITGLGCVTPIGIGVDEFWTAAIKGTNGIGPIDAFDTTDFKTKVGGQVKDFNAHKYMDDKRAATMGRSSQFAIAAAKMAIADSKLNIAKEDAYRIGVSMGTTMGEPQILEKAIVAKYANNGNADAVDASLPRQYPCGVISGHVAAEFGVKGPVMMIPTACAAGNYAIGYAYDLLRMGRIDVAIAGGSDPLSRIAFTGFNRLLATVPEVCRPFSKNREGMAVSEGAGIIILETLEHALKRNAPIYAELLGYGLACDAHKMTIPDPEGSGGITAMSRAIANSGIDPRDVDYISAHGTGTGENDKIETAIVKSVLGDKAAKTPMSSIKSMIGHTMGAASAIEAVACALAIKYNLVPPTINYSEPDPECDLDYVPNTAREMPVDLVISNAYAFAGNCSAIVLRRFKS